MKEFFMFFVNLIESGMQNYYLEIMFSIAFITLIGICVLILQDDKDFFKDFDVENFGIFVIVSAMALVVGVLWPLVVVVLLFLIICLILKYIVQYICNYILGRINK